MVPRRSASSRVSTLSAVDLVVGADVKERHRPLRYDQRQGDAVSIGQAYGMLPNEFSAK